jgi:hypothetical protein
MTQEIHNVLSRADREYVDDGAIYILNTFSFKGFVRSLDPTVHEVQCLTDSLHKKARIHAGDDYVFTTIFEPDGTRRHLRSSKGVFDILEKYKLL